MYQESDSIGSAGDGISGLQSWAAWGRRSCFVGSFALAWAKCTSAFASSGWPPVVGHTRDCGSCRGFFLAAGGFAVSIAFDCWLSPRDAFGYRRAEAGAMLTFFFRCKCNHVGVAHWIHPCASWGCLRKRMLIDLDSPVGVGATSKGRSSSNSLNIHLRRSAAPYSTHELKLILVCLSTNLRHLVSLDSWRRELSGVVAGLGRGAGRLSRATTVCASGS